MIHLFCNKDEYCSFEDGFSFAVACFVCTNSNACSCVVFSIRDASFFTVIR